MNRWRRPAVTQLYMGVALALSVLVPGIAHSQPPTASVQHAPSLIYQQTKFVEEVGGQTQTFNFDVPSGKVLVVENVSARVFVPTGQTVTGQMNCNGVSPAADFSHGNKFLIFDIIPSGTNNRFVAHHLTRCYVFGTSSASELVMVIQRDSASGNFVSVDVSISGYLIDAP